MTKRIFLIDLMRFTAIALMVIFHLTYNLDQFHYVSVDFGSPFWFWLPRIIVTLFLLCVGMSLSVVHSSGFKSRKFWPRLVKLLIGALFISISTYIMFPQQWVYFGTLHCIAATTLMAVPFIKRPNFSLVVGLLILVSMYFTGVNFTNVERVFKSNSMDFIPVYPWFSIVLIGIYLETFRLGDFDIAESRLKHFIKWCSAHSLYIYLVHQPLMYGVVYLVYRATHSE